MHKILSVFPKHLVYTQSSFPVSVEPVLASDCDHQSEGWARGPLGLPAAPSDPGGGLGLRAAARRAVSAAWLP